MIILGTNSIKDTGYDVANSLRFNSGSSDYLNRTHGTNNTAVTKYTISFWIKRSDVGSEQVVLTSYTDGNNLGLIRFNANNTLEIYDYQSSFKLRKITNRVFRDTSAWYHIVISSDVSVSSPVLGLYINGVQETSFSTDTNYSQNDSNMFNKNVLNWIGANPYGSGTGYTNGYMAEFCFIDGTAYDEENFGEFDEDSPTIWKPINVSGLTFGTNGFYLDFEDSANLGNDANGGTDFTVNNLTAIDQSTDTCTNNFSTMNPLANKVTSVTFSEGNLKIDFANGRGGSTSTFGLTTGKWYVEYNITTMPVDERFHFGIVPREIQDADDMINTNNQGTAISGYNAAIYADSGSGMAILDNFFGSNTTRFDSFTGIIGMALDITNGTIAFSKAGAWVTGSGTTDTDFSNALKVDISTPLARHDVWHIGCGTGNSTGTSGVFSINFGSPAFSISSGNSDGNGYGNFEYAVPSGYYSICSKNLSEFG